MALHPDIRELGSGDLAPLLDLYRYLHPDERSLSVDERVESIWQQLCDDPLQIYMGGFIDGKLSAACTASIIRNLTRGGRSWAVIENVITRPECRRQGVGRAVMERLIARCREHDCYKIMLMSGMERREIHPFYTALGFDADAKQAFMMKL